MYNGGNRMFASGANTIVHLGNSTIIGNGGGLITSGGGIIFSYQNNQASGNVTDGGPTYTLTTK